MIHALRQQHLRTFAALAVLLPVGLLVGLRARPAPARVAALPEDLAAAGGWDGRGGSVLWTSTENFASLHLTESLLQDADGKTAVSLQPQADVESPDVLVYWTPRDTKGSTSVPDDAVLLGALAGAHARIFPLPDTTTHTGRGGILLYSLAHGTVLGEAWLAGTR